MEVRFTRLSNNRHRLEVVRPDRSGEQRELETRSLLLHDLVHFAVEAEAKIADGFWGSVADGARFAELTPGPEGFGDRTGLALAEALVGPMQSVWHQRMTPDHYISRVQQTAPFVDEDFVAAVLERIRRLWGRWRGTPFHQTMVLSWPPEPR